MNPDVGDRFGKMTVTGPGVSDNGRKFPVQCDCGSRPLMANVTQLARWEKNDNGCTKCEPRQKTHGRGTDDSTYGTWYSMKQRCLNPKNNRYHRYGGRGIKICKRWSDSFEAFLEDMGERPEGKTLDREDTDGNYEKDNCRWATHEEQCANTSQNHKHVVAGIEYPSTALLISAYSLNRTATYKALKSGLTAEQIVGVK